MPSPRSGTTAPCKTFAGRDLKTAAGGEINCLDPGGFGVVTITKAVTLFCEGVSNGGVLASGTDGIIVAAGLPRLSHPKFAPS